MTLVRQFSPTDIPQVAEVVNQSLGENYPPSLYLTVHNLWGEGFLVITDDRQVIGFVAAVPAGQKVARVLMLAVLPESRRRSLGKVLMAELYASCRAKGFDTIVLEVRKSNKSAIGFYERQGFAISGEIKNFYSNGEEAWKMMKSLQN
ncbi:MAG: hypothetical protein A3K60_06715 [Euryarchaeota archaeon RBG_19FT_COMBO_56_21]|nr:MAG: hypothetical protein A3K60_06715 [Euryarchaeota archaeon RBG_19FT_COMBO_56_21]